MAKRAKSTVIEVKGSHVAFVHSQAAAIAKLIETAATTVKVPRQLASAWARITAPRCRNNAAAAGCIPPPEPSAEPSPVSA